MVSRPPKGTSLRGTASSDVFLRQNRCTRLGCSLSQEPKKVAEPSHFVQRGAKSRMRRTETPKPILIKFCTVVDIPDVLTYTNFGDHRLRGFWVAGGQISPTHIDFHRRPYNTLALPCERVICCEVTVTATCKTNRKPSKPTISPQQIQVMDFVRVCMSRVSLLQPSSR